MPKLQDSERKDGRQAYRRDSISALFKHIGNCKKTNGSLTQEKGVEGSKRKERKTKIKEFYCKNRYFGQPQAFQEIFLNNGGGGKEQIPVEKGNEQTNKRKSALLFISSRKLIPALSVVCCF